MNSRINQWAEEHIARIDLQRFQSNLINWGRVYGRRFPWRDTTDAYKILISEILLHRTRAEQVVPLYETLIRAYPTPSSLARAPMEHLQEHLKSAGLRWRIDLMGATAKDLVSRFGGQIPRSDEDLQSLPGVGPYIAAAVLCFAYGEAVPILDTNTVRILGRVFGLRVTDGSRRSPRFRALMGQLVDPDSPREFNYALLDLGALICRPRRDQVLLCPLALDCEFGKTLVSERNVLGMQRLPRPSP